MPKLCSHMIMMCVGTGQYVGHFSRWAIYWSKLSFPKHQCSLCTPSQCSKCINKFKMRQGTVLFHWSHFLNRSFSLLQAERDILVKKVFPRIDALCRERGTYCTPVDLRWGINDTQVNSGLVIQMCLNYISRCSPFFICLLGERYGSHRPNDTDPLPACYEDLTPTAHWLDKSFMIAASAGYDWVLQDTYQHCSITELEVIQAAFLGENTDHCLFYFRQPEHVDSLYTDLAEEERVNKLKLYEPECEYSNLKVRDLKARIVKKGLAVKYFKTPEELSKLVLQDYSAIVDRMYPPLEEILSDKCELNLQKAKFLFRYRSKPQICRLFDKGEITSWKFWVCVCSLSELVHVLSL